MDGWTVDHYDSFADMPSNQAALAKEKAKSEEALRKVAPRVLRLPDEPPKPPAAPPMTAAAFDREILLAQPISSRDRERFQREKYEERKAARYPQSETPSQPTGEFPWLARAFDGADPAELDIDLDYEGDDED